MPTEARYSSCRARIRWAVTETGNRIPLDADPVDDGNLAARKDGDTIRVRTLGTGELADGELRFVSHFASCPHAAGHRKRASSAATR
jgi:hypothetical protein